MYGMFSLKLLKDKTPKVNEQLSDKDVFFESPYLQGAEEDGQKKVWEAGGSKLLSPNYSVKNYIDY